MSIRMCKETEDCAICMTVNANEKAEFHGICYVCRKNERDDRYCYLCSSCCPKMDHMECLFPSEGDYVEKNN